MNGSWGSSFKIWESPQLLRADRPCKVCLLMWGPEGKANLEVRWFCPCQSSRPYPARYSSPTFKCDGKALQKEALASRTNL